MLKVFVFEKPTEEISSIFRFRGSLDNIYTFTLKEPEEIRSIVLSNPLSSNCIFTINHLQLTSGENNHVTLLMAEKLENTHHNKNPEKTELKLCFYKDHKELKSSTEILYIEKLRNELLEVLSSNYVIILPGGGLIIDLENPEKDLELCVSYSIEKL